MGSPSSIKRCHIQLAAERLHTDVEGLLPDLRRLAAHERRGGAMRCHTQKLANNRPEFGELVVSRGEQIEPKAPLKTYSLGLQVD